MTKVSARRHPVPDQPLDRSRLGETLHLAVPKYLAVQSDDEDTSPPWDQRDLRQVGLEAP